MSRPRSTWELTFMVAQPVTAVATIAASVSPVRRRMADTSVAPYASLARVNNVCENDAIPAVALRCSVRRRAHPPGLLLERGRRRLASLHHSAHHPLAHG